MPVNFATLRPTNDTLEAIAQAMARVEVACKGVAAEIGQQQQQLAGLLVAGSAKGIKAAEAEIHRLTNDGQKLMLLHGELLRRLNGSMPQAYADLEAKARANALNAATTMAEFWSEHGAVLQQGMNLVGTAAEAIAVWARATISAQANGVPKSSNAQAQQMPPPSNVEQLRRPTPPASA